MLKTWKDEVVEILFSVKKTLMVSSELLESLDEE